MPKWTPCKRATFARRLRKLGFAGLFSGAKHQFMVWGQHRLTIPSNHEFSVPQLKMMVREVESILEREIPLKEWNELD